MAEEPKSSFSSEEEIRILERQLEEKKRALASRPESPAAGETEEKELLRGIIKERIDELRPSRMTSNDTQSSSTPASAPTPSSPAPAVGDDNAIAEREEALRRLIELALTHTIEQAVKSAQRESPYLLDELHDHLVDRYYDKLLQLRKITPR